MPDNPLNAVNRGVYISDNLPFLRRLNDGCIDLVCIDPPFDKNETFGRREGDKKPDLLKPPLSEDERRIERGLLQRWGIRNPDEATEAGIDWPETAYKDFWSWEDDVHDDWLTKIEVDYPSVAKLIDATRDIHGEGTAAYLCYMAVRLFEIRRVLKDTGTLYLHCDHTANSYLRQLLDAIFGKANFRNEITWERTRGRSDGNHWGNTTDTILFYSRSGNYVYQNVYQDRIVVNETTMGDLTAAEIRNGVSGETWRGYNPTNFGRHWAVPRNNRLAKWINDNRIPGYLQIQNPHDRLDALNDAGMIAWSDKGRPSIIRPSEASAGAKVNNLWSDISRAASNERTGYPTQKPIALAERIIKASCPEGGVVLDCFAGCAYVAIAAERLGRDWVACDINPRAWTVFKRQFSKPKLALLKCSEPMIGDALQAPLIGNDSTVWGPDELPEDTIRADVAPATLPPPKERPRPVPDSLIPREEMLEFLLGLSGYTAWCCGFANRKPDGTVVRTMNNFHLDHLEPKRLEGSNEIYNRAPMCPHHNIRKNVRRVHLDEYRDEIAAAGELLVDDVSQLVNTRRAQDQVMDFWAMKRAERPFQQGFDGRFAPVAR